MKAKVLLCQWDRLSREDRLAAMAGTLFPGQEFYEEASIREYQTHDHQAVCEAVFQECQNVVVPWRDPPCRSFSVSDCVEIEGSLYFCINVGFKALPDGARREVQ